MTLISGAALAIRDAERDPDDFADQYVRDNDDGKSRILLVAASRGADAEVLGKPIWSFWWD